MPEQKVLNEPNREYFQLRFWRFFDVISFWMRSFGIYDINWVNGDQFDTSFIVDKCFEFRWLLGNFDKAISCCAQYNPAFSIIFSAIPLPGRDVTALVVKRQNTYF